MRKSLTEFFHTSTETNYRWLETTARPPVRSRTTDILHRKISTQIICQDIEDETPFVKLVWRALLSIDPSVCVLPSSPIFRNSSPNTVNERRCNEPERKRSTFIKDKGNISILSTDVEFFHVWVYSAQWYGPLQPPPAPALYRRTLAK